MLNSIKSLKNKYCKATLNVFLQKKILLIMTKKRIKMNIIMLIKKRVSLLNVKQMNFNFIWLYGKSLFVV